MLQKTKKPPYGGGFEFVELVDDVGYLFENALAVKVNAVLASEFNGSFGNGEDGVVFANLGIKARKDA